MSEEPAVPVDGSPGTVLRRDYMIPHRLGVVALAAALKVTTVRLEGMLLGKQPVTPDLAIRLSIYFGTTPMFWMALQIRQDLIGFERTSGKKIRMEVLPRDSR